MFAAQHKELEHVHCLTKDQRKKNSVESRFHLYFDQRDKSKKKNIITVLSNLFYNFNDLSFPYNSN